MTSQPSGLQVSRDIIDTALPPDINTSVKHMLLFYRRGITVRLVKGRPGSASKPRLRLGFWGLRLYKKEARAATTASGRLRLGLGPSRGFAVNKKIFYNLYYLFLYISSSSASSSSQVLDPSPTSLLPPFSPTSSRSISSRSSSSSVAATTSRKIRSL
jgi:hypothetical protein